MKPLTVSQQNYLSAVYVLSPSGEGAQVTDIAHMVGVKKSSASIAIQLLQKKGLVNRDSGRKVYLTSEGERQAVFLLNKYAIMRRFLTDVLHVDPGTADMDAGAMKPLVSMESLCAICKFMNHITERCVCSKGRQSQTGSLCSSNPKDT